MTFMHEGGIPMWLTLVLFMAAAGVAGVLRRDGGGRLAALGAVACLASGLVGFAAGLYNVVAYAQGVEAAQRADVLGIGLGEAANNLLWGGALGLVLVVVAVALGRARPSAPATA